MGTFTASNHVLNKELLTKAQFKKAFVGAMKSQGCTTATEDDAALSFTLIFSPDRKWVTVLSEEYQSGGHETRADASRFAKSLGTSVVSVSLVDSDFAEFELYDSSGKLADVMTLGESYLGDEAPMGTEESWQPLLTGGTWEQVTAIQSGSYTFAEDALLEFAPLIGMDGRNILLDSEDVSDEDNAEVLYFKKAAEKQLTLNAAFKQVFGEALEPLGYVQAKVKHKYPIYIKVVSDELIHVITIRKVDPDRIDESAFEILGDAVTLYWEYMDTIFASDNYSFFKSNFSIFHYFTYRQPDGPDHEYMHKLHKFSYKTNDKNSMLSAMHHALDITNQLLLPAINKVTDLNSFIEYYYLFHTHMMSFWYDAEEFAAEPEPHAQPDLVIVKAKYRDDGVERLNNEVKWNMKYKQDGYSEKTFEEQYEKDDKFRIRQNEIRDKMIDDPVINAKVLALLEKHKALNIEKLRSYGIII